MKIDQCRISGPYTHENLTVFLVHRAGASDTDEYLTLEEALDQKKILIHETGNVRQLEVENLLDDRDIYIQAGELVRGGRQDRTLGVDFVLPAGKRMPIPSFCVEMSRWHPRGVESAAAFSSSKHYLTSKPMKLAAKLHHNQSAVWASVAAYEQKVSQAVGAPVCHHMSPSSLELMLEHKKLGERRDQIVKALKGLAGQHADAVGFAFAINGELNSAEAYTSPRLFHKLWKKLVTSAAVEAISEQTRQTQQKPEPTPEVVARFLAESEEANAESREITDRVVLRTHRQPKSVLFETQDKKSPHPWLHRNYIT